MGLETFTEGLELIKNNAILVESTKRNLEASGDKERLEVFNKFFGSKTKAKKEEDKA